MFSLPTMTALPLASEATDGIHWLPNVNVLTWNSPPRRFPLPSYRWPKTPKLFQSWWALLQTTTKSPPASEETEGPP